MKQTFVKNRKDLYIYRVKCENCGTLIAKTVAKGKRGVEIKCRKCGVYNKI